MLTKPTIIVRFIEYITFFLAIIVSTFYDLIEETLFDLCRLCNVATSNDLMSSDLMSNDLMSNDLMSDELLYNTYL